MLCSGRLTDYRSQIQTRFVVTEIALRQRIYNKLDRLGDVVGGVELFQRVGHLVRPDIASHSPLEDLVEDSGESVDHTERSSERLRIRPVLVVLAAKAAGAARVEPELQHAAELMHGALQLHDLALGNTGGRRRRIARRLLNRSTGWLSGSHLTMRALELTKVASPQALGDLVETLRAFSDGVVVAQEIIDGGEVTDSSWEEHVDTHVGALYTFCCRAGARLAGDDPRVLAAMGRYGRHLGRVTRLFEDIQGLDKDPLGHFEDSLASGRPIHAIAAVMKENANVATAWRAYQAEATEANGNKLLSALRMSQGIQESKRRMLSESWAARRALHTLSESPYKDGLDALVQEMQAMTGKKAG
jgi:octaprenyl-diphosphate synthase